jgi:5-methylcytosine-specific restriction enzyme A
MTAHRAPSPCSGGCGRLVATPGKCDACLSKARKQQDAQRGSAAERGYGNRWQKARATYLRKNPLCVHCKAEDRLIAATVVDHRIPHRGDWVLFWDTDNWQSLCKRHHDVKTATEDGGFGRTE